MSIFLPIYITLIAINHQFTGILKMRVFANLICLCLLTSVVNGQDEKLGELVELVETRHEIPSLKAPKSYEFKNNTIDVELSEYAGYSGLIVANQGLKPNEQSYFFKKFGFMVNITLSEEESWSSLNSGRLAASATTVDVLAAYGNQFDVAVPALISYSRGDGLIASNNIKSINDFKGKVVVVSQFTEVDFFIRYLANEAGLKVSLLDDISDKPNPNTVNLIFTADGFAAGDLYIKEIISGKNRISGCVTWEPKMSEVLERLEKKVHLLTTNKNLLIIADILIVNKGFSVKHKDKVNALTEGLIYGNSLLKDDPDKYLDILSKAFNWTVDESKEELQKVHFANLPENMQFFAGSLVSAGSFNYIYEVARSSYGSSLIGKSHDLDKTLLTNRLSDLTNLDIFKNQVVSIVPKRISHEAVESSDQPALLSKDIHFKFKANRSELDSNQADNKSGLESINNLLTVSPGSRILLRGHADGSNLEAFRKQGGEAAVRDVILTLKELSKNRCQELKKHLIDQYKIDGSRISIYAVGPDEPTGKGPAADRRVEVKWITVE